MDRAKLHLLKCRWCRVLKNSCYSQSEGRFIKNQEPQVTTVHTCLKSCSCVTVPGSGESDAQFWFWVTRRRCTGLADTWLWPMTAVVEGPTKVSLPGAQDVCTWAEPEEETPVHVWVTLAPTWVPLTIPWFKISWPLGVAVKFCPETICTVFVFESVGPLWMLVPGVNVSELGSKKCPGCMFVCACTCCCSEGTTMEPLDV